MVIDNLVSSLIGFIYEAAIDADGWDSVLSSLGTAFSAEAVVLWRSVPAGRREGVVSSLGLPAGFGLESGLEDPARDARLLAEARIAPGEMEEFSAILRLGEPIFGEMPAKWRDCLDLERGVAVAVLREADHASTLELVRANGSEPFGSLESNLARWIAPHLARAITIERDREQNRARNTAAAALGERLPVGAILVDRHAVVLDCSRRAREILDDGDGLSAEEGRLCAPKRAETLRLRRSIEEAASAAAGDGPGAELSLTLERRSGRAPLALEITHVANGAADSRQGESQALVYVRDPDRGAELSSVALRRLYGLTRTEAQVTSLISRGMSHSDAARELGVTVCAVRFHLKSIYAKTATQRQAELVYMLATGSAQLTA